MDKYKIVINNLDEYDGSFYYAVKSTGIFCKPSCKSKVPNETNVEYFDSTKEAISAGYRACKRCKPELNDYEPDLEVVQQVCSILDSIPYDRLDYKDSLDTVGMSYSRISVLFKERVGISIQEYITKRRLVYAKELLKSYSILDTSLKLGYSGTSGFYAFFKKNEGISPGEYKRFYVEKSQV